MSVIESISSATAGLSTRNSSSTDGIVTPHKDHSNNDARNLDIPFDWLYKGKGKSRKRSKSSHSPANKIDGNKKLDVPSRRSRSTSISNAALSTNHSSLQGTDSFSMDHELEKFPILTPISSRTDNHRDFTTPLNDNSSAIDDSAGFDSPEAGTGALKKSSRSRSITNAVATKSGFLSSNASTVSNTLGVPKSSSAIKRSSSTNDKGKKSLFGTIFGKKSTKPALTLGTPLVTTTASASKEKLVLKTINTTNPPSPNTRITRVASGTIKEPASPLIDISSPSLTPSTNLSMITTSSSSSSFTSRNVAHINNLSKVSLKRVRFSVNKFSDDPPQQLPSRNPTFGNVLVPDDMISDLPTISYGITAVQNPTATDPATTRTTFSKDSREYKHALDIQRKALKEAAMHQKEAHFAAKRIEYEVTTFKSDPDYKSSPTSNTSTIKEVAEDIGAGSTFHADNLESIDKPIHMHQHHFGNESTDDEEQEITLGVVYTRCCHLREILPIPSTLKQVKGKTAPLQVLKFLNAKPTLIDVLSFCDFISITHINTVVFDNVYLTPEMFRIVICSIANSKNLEKLSMKNVLIENQSWILFCKFLLHNNSIIKLDISQTSTKNILKDKNSTVEIPDNNEFLRHNMDWNLFAMVLMERKGRPIEELLLNGIKFSKHISLDTFENILNSFSQQKNSAREHASFALRLGLANSEISVNFERYLLNWMSTTKNSAMSKTFYVQGVDTSFNDISQYVKTMVNRLSSLNYNNLEYFTLNSSGIQTSYDLALIIKYLSRLPNLKFLDLSNIPQVFPDILPFLHKYLPRFSSLKRIHMDSNDVPYKELSVICNILLKCTTLTHISIMQHTPLPEDENQVKFARNNCWAVLYGLVRDSHNLVGLDINYDAVPEEIQSRIALSLVSNMNRAMGSFVELDDLTTQDNLLFDGSLLSDTAEQVLEKLNRLKEDSIQMNAADKTKIDSTKKYLLKKYFEKLHRVQGDVQSNIDILFEKRRVCELELLEKENLVRFLLLEKNLCNILELCNNIPEFNSIIDSKDQLFKHENKHFESTAESGNSESVVNEPETETDTLIRPHLMATDSGRTIDCVTGKPLLFKSNSSTLMHGKEQEREEGELHKWGFFVQQQNDIYPDNNGNSVDTNKSLGSDSSSSSTTNSTTNTTMSSVATDPTQSTKNLITKIPSGADLRSAIIQAKGIDSISDLIHNVSDDKVTLETIYGHECVKTKVTEAYDRLLNDISEGRNVTAKSSDAEKQNP